MDSKILPEPFNYPLLSYIGVTGTQSHPLLPAYVTGTPSHPLLPAYVTGTPSQPLPSWLHSYLGSRLTWVVGVLLHTWSLPLSHLNMEFLQGEVKSKL